MLILGCDFQTLSADFNGNYETLYRSKPLFLEHTQH